MKSVTSLVQRLAYCSLWLEPVDGEIASSQVSCLDFVLTERFDRSDWIG